MQQDRIGDRIRTLFSQSPVHVTVVAPFIKVTALESLLSIVPDSSQLRCVTRWLPQDIAQGVTDLEVLDVIENRGNGTLTLVDNLHAKIYVADDVCLVGSSNVTLRGFGDISQGNVEILVETTLDDPGVATALAEIAHYERPATRTLANQLRQSVELLTEGAIHQTGKLGWIPLSFKPESAFHLYSQFQSTYNSDLLLESDRVVLEDIFRADVVPDNSEFDFVRTIREKLASIPPAKEFLEQTADKLLTFRDVYGYFSQYDFDNHSGDDLWRAFVNWMSYFYPDRVMTHEIVEIALRRARRVV